MADPGPDDEARAIARARSLLLPIRTAAEQLQGQDFEPTCRAVDAATVDFPGTSDLLQEITERLWETRMACDAWRADPWPERAAALADDIS
ncbi:MAG: hypothetical protein ACXV0U_10585, partial [Kineosporiaceae bacterium]